jgi:hypothetical protein
MSDALGYDPCFKCDKKDILCSMCELTYHRNKQIVDEEDKPTYCKYCFNARVYKPTEEELMDPFATELTDENDSSSCGVGHCFSRNRRFMINSGHGHPVNITFEEWTEKMPEWHRVGIYYPKCCPECGRRLDEYDVSET